MPTDLEQGSNPDGDVQAAAPRPEVGTGGPSETVAGENVELTGNLGSASSGNSWNAEPREESHVCAFTRDACNVVLLLLLACFICIFTWAWVDAFQKANYDQAVGLMLILFFGTVVCTCGFRRRVAVLSQLEVERMQQVQADHMEQVGEVMQGPKGVPAHVRKDFHYFIFGDCATADEDMKEPPPSPTPAQPPRSGEDDAGSRGGEGAQSLGAPAVSRVGSGLGDGTGGAEAASDHADAHASSECLHEVEVQGERDGIPAASAPPMDQSFPQEEARDTTPTHGAVVIVDESGEGSATPPQALEQRQEGARPGLENPGENLSSPPGQEGQQHPRDDTQSGPTFAWASTSLTDCSVCLESYKSGDRVCRLPCAHAFHAVCIDTWLDQQHVCPQCRYNLLPDARSPGPGHQENAIVAGPAPYSSLFRSPLGMMPAMPPASAPTPHTGGPYVTFPDTPQARLPSPLFTSATMSSLRRSPGYAGGAGGRSRGALPPSAGVSIGNPMFNVFPRNPSVGSLSRLTAAQTGLIFSAETPGIGGRPRSGRLSHAPLGRVARAATPRDPNRQLRQPPGHDARQQGAQGQLEARVHGQQYAQGQSRQRQVTPLQATRYGASPRASVLASAPSLGSSTNGNVLVGGGTGSVQSTSLSNLAGSAISAGSVGGGGSASAATAGAAAGAGQSCNAMDAGSNVNLSDGHGQRRLRLPSLGRRPRSSSCDVITSPGLFGMGNSSSPKATPARERLTHLPSWGTPTFRGSAQFKGFPSLQVRMTSWDEGDDFAGSVSSNTSRCRRRRGSEEWGTRDWDRARILGEAPTTATTATPAATPTATTATEPSVRNQLGGDSEADTEADGDDNSAVTEVSEGLVSPRGEHVPRFGYDDDESLSTSTDEHEYFARTMLYC